MAQPFDVAILGAGPAGEHACHALVRAGRTVLLVERELIGGECSNWACIPTKTLLRATEVSGESKRAAGVARAALEWPDLARYRDYMTSAGDDSGRVKGYQDIGVTVVKGDGRLAGAGRLRVGDDIYEAGAILITTGSDPVIPPITGLQEAGYWTNREATALHEIPESVVLIGGGPVGVELAQFLRRFGCSVSVIEGAPALVAREDPRVSELLADSLRADGVRLHLGAQALRVNSQDGMNVVALSDGSQLHGERVIVAVGRRARRDDIGLDTIGVTPGGHSIEVDARCRVAEGVWAAGDCTGVAMFTHVAKYQARVAVADMLGRPVDADYRAIPRVVFTDPEVAAVGETEAHARSAGRDIAVSRIELPTSIARPDTYEENPRGELGLVADRQRGELVGAWAVAPLAGEWIHQAVLAIRARVPLDVLTDTIAQFPSYSEAFLSGLQALEL